MKAIEYRLRKTIGLDPASLGPSSLPRAVGFRMKTLGLAEISEYRQVLEQEPAQWRELVETLLVTETWFFREPEAFESVVGLLRRNAAPRHKPWRLLSVPCSSGEEPYSLAMALLDAGFSPKQFQIDAFDISARALELARRGVYGKNSFRNADCSFRERHFRPTTGGFLINKGIRERVAFHEANILGDDFAPGANAYDVIFFRNLLIYFDPAARQRALAKITSLLAPSGMLFVGPAEQALALTQGLVSARLPGAFACQKTAAAFQGDRAAGAASGTPSRSGFTGLIPGAAKGEGVQPEPAASRSVLPDLGEVRWLAASGRLVEAEILCEAYLSKNRDSAPGYYLLGLLREDQGDSRALDCYRKALYLEPNHYESLLRMSLLVEKQGDAAQASNLKRRAQRLAPSPLGAMGEPVTPRNLPANS